MADSLFSCMMYGVTECLLSTQILVERGLSFPDAISLLNTEVFPGEGFYISKKVRIKLCPLFCAMVHFQSHHKICHSVVALPTQNSATFVTYTCMYI